MALSNELKKIKKTYGENFMKLCRSLFPTLLEQEGRLYRILATSFSTNCKTLYEDITQAELEDEFKSYIYSKVDVEDQEKKMIKEKTPYELLEEAGYELTECLTEEEIQKFRKYYALGEELCTFRGNRLNRCVVFWAVKNGVENIKRGALQNGIKSIKLPESFIGNDIGYGAFPSIEYLYLPKNVSSFNKNAYYNVKTIEVSKDNPYLQSINNEYILSKDGTELYWVKRGLTEVNIPESVETIKSNALMVVKAQEIVLPKKVKKLESGILQYASTKKITIQSQVSEINTNAFSNANNLSEVIIHKKNDGTLTGSPWGCVYGDKAIKWDN